MKTLLVFLLVGFVALTIALVVRAQRRENERRTREHWLRETSAPHRETMDAGFVTTSAVFGLADPTPGPAPGTDCAASSDAGGSCASDGGS